jgi:hypothetical protein
MTFLHLPSLPLPSSVPETLRRCDFKILYYYYKEAEEAYSHPAAAAFAFASAFEAGEASAKNENIL